MEALRKIVPGSALEPLFSLPHSSGELQYEVIVLPFPADNEYCRKDTGQKSLTDSLRGTLDGVEFECTLKADDLNADVIQSLKNAYHQREIVILPKDEYVEMEKARHNAAYEEELKRRIKELDEGKGIVVAMEQLYALEEGKDPNIVLTMEQLRAMEND